MMFDGLRKLLGIKSREQAFFDLFEQRADIARGSVSILSAIGTSLEINDNWDDAMIDIEHRCDELTAKIIVKAEQQNLMIVSLECEDVVQLAKAFDDAVDMVEELVTKIIDYAFVPDEILKQFLVLVSESVGYICDSMFCLRHFDSIADLREKMKDCEHRSDALVRPVIRESDELKVANLLDKRRYDMVTVDDLQCVVDAQYYQKRRRELAELAEDTVDACKQVFNVLGNMYMKEA